MAKQRLTKRQQNERRLQAQQDEAARRRLLKELEARPAKPKATASIALPSLNYDQSRSVQHYPSGLTLAISPKAEPKFDPRDLDEEAYDEYLAREAEAQKEIQVKKTRVAPMYNKGPYQFLTEGTDPKQLGHRKL